MKHPIVARGYVFEDDRENGHGQLEKKGVPGVVVTNQREVVRTDEKGYFTLPVYEDCCITVTKPAGYDWPTDPFGQPQFFYRYFPNGTPDRLDLDYRGPDPTGELPDLLHFPLLRARKKSTFRAVMLGDIQPICETDIGYFRDMMIDELADKEVDFMVPLGDLVWDKLELLPLVRETLGATGHRWYPVCGNHDINLKAPEPEYAKVTFQRMFGPTYYSFDHGDVHFVVLDDIGYTGWDVQAEEKGATIGWVDERQLQWLANDLRHVPEDKLVFVMSHIPIYTEIAAEHDYRNVMNRNELFAILRQRKHLYSVSAHTHFVERPDLRAGGWMGEADFPALIAGAACGAWWKGPRDPGGLPVRMAMDGTPNGYFIFHFAGNTCSFQFCPAGQAPETSQMGVRFPRGDLFPGDLSRQDMVVNVYRGHPRAEVTARINGGVPIRLQRTLQPDPGVASFLAAHRKAYPSWMQARMNAHLWTAPMPDDLKPGIYRLELEAREPDGEVLRASQTFRVKPPKDSHQDLFAPHKIPADQA